MTGIVMFLAKVRQNFGHTFSTMLQRARQASVEKRPSAANGRQQIASETQKYRDAPVDPCKTMTRTLGSSSPVRKHLGCANPSGVVAETTHEWFLVCLGSLLPY